MRKVFPTNTPNIYRYAVQIVTSMDSSHSNFVLIAKDRGQYEKLVDLIDSLSNTMRATLRRNGECIDSKRGESVHDFKFENGTWIRVLESEDNINCIRGISLSKVYFGETPKRESVGMVVPVVAACGGHMFYDTEKGINLNIPKEAEDHCPLMVRAIRLGKS